MSPSRIRVNGGWTVISRPDCWQVIGHGDDQRIDRRTLMCDCWFGKNYVRSCPHQFAVSRAIAKARTGSEDLPQAIAGIGHCGEQLRAVITYFAQGHHPPDSTGNGRTPETNPALTSGRLS